MTEDMKNFMGKLSDQMHYTDVFNDESGDKMKNLIDRNKRWERESQERKQKKEDETKKYQAYDAHIETESLRGLLPQVKDTLEDNQYKYTGTMDHVEKVHHETFLNLERLSTAEIEKRLETAKKRQMEYMKDAMNSNSYGSRQCASDQGILISLYQAEIDKRAVNE